MGRVDRPLAAKGVARDRIVLALAGFGLVVPAGRASRVLPALATLGTLVIAGLALNVGHAGGELVYRHGAARADPAAAADSPGQLERASRHRARVLHASTPREALVRVRRT
jgi:hypothetical protein